MRSRKGDAFIAGYNKTTIYDPPRQLDLFVNVAAYFGLEQLPSAQNVASPKNILSTEVGVKYTNTRKSLGGVDHEKGIAWRVIGGDRPCPGRHLPAYLGRDRLWRAAAAHEQFGLDLCPGRHRRRARSESPLGAYYFGSFRNNYVDNRPEKRYREMESFPGFDIDQIAARKFAQADRRDQPAAGPLRRNRHAGLLPELCPAGPVRRNDAARALHRSEATGCSIVGAQVDLGFTVAMRLPMVFSVGVARGFGDKDIDGRTEWLASLKIM